MSNCGTQGVEFGAHNEIWLPSFVFVQYGPAVLIMVLFPNTDWSYMVLTSTQNKSV